jgi:hypothetical protein
MCHCSCSHHTLLLAACHAAAAAAAGNARKKGVTTSYLMASDARLLEIMKQQGLQCFVNIMALQRGPKLGMQGMLYKLMEQLVTKSGSIKECCGE